MKPSHSRTNRTVRAENLGRKALQYQRSGAFRDAVKHYEKALEIAPDHPEILANLGVCFGAMRQNDRALRALSKAHAIAPGHPAIESALGQCLYSIGDLERARPLLDSSLRGAPGDPRVSVLLAKTLEGLGRIPDAIAALERFLTMARPPAPPLHELARLCEKARYRVKAAQVFERLVELEPDRLDTNVHGYFALQRIARWSALAKFDNGRLERSLADAGAEPTQENYPGGPFYLLARLQDRVAHLRASQRHAARLVREHNVREPFQSWPEWRGDRPLRVGYLSADFHDHATMHLMGGAFRAHDPDRVEIYSYSYGPDKNDAARRLVVERSAGFRDIRKLSARKAAQEIHQDSLDLLIDLKGYTRGSRSEIAAWRPARVQAAYLGYPGTSGAPFIDYAIVDETVAPPEHQDGFSEILAYHPLCYQPNDLAQPVAERPSSRETWGLPAEGVVFCSFNQSYKIDPVRFDGWMEALRAVEGSALWLQSDSAEADAALRKEAAARGVAPERLIFASKVSKDQHLERLRHADIGLDTRLYNGHTTTTDALLMEVPVIAAMGEHFAARVAASLLRAIGAPELIAEDEKAYVAMAIRLAREPEMRASLKRKLAAAKSGRFFNTQRHTRALETLFEAMVARGPAAIASREPVRVD